jgi:hypothetical protein
MQLRTTEPATTGLLKGRRRGAKRTNDGFMIQHPAAPVMRKWQFVGDIRLIEFTFGRARSLDGRQVNRNWMGNGKR